MIRHTMMIMTQAFKCIHILYYGKNNIGVGLWLYISIFYCRIGAGLPNL